MSRPPRPSPPSLTALMLGQLPTAVINAALRLALPEGNVHFSIRAQQHARKKHPADFRVCLRHIQQIVATPSFVGRGPHQTEGFELVSEIQQGQAIVLVAIRMQPDASGQYGVASTYLIDRNKFERRVRKGFLKAV